MASIARLLLFCFILQSPVFAVDTIQLQLDSLQTAFFNTEDIELTYGLQQSSRPGIFLLVNKIHSPYFEKSFNAALTCSEAIYNIQTLQCTNGALNISYPGLEVIVVSLIFNINFRDYSGEMTLNADTRWGKVKADFSATENHVWRLDFNTEDLHLTRLSYLLESLLEIFKGHVITSGKVNIQAKFDGFENNITEVTMNAGLTELSIEGESVLENVELQLQTTLKRSNASWSFQNLIRLINGEMYVQTGFRILGEKPGFYIESSTDPNVVNLEGSWHPEQNLLELRDLYYLHPSIFQLQGSGRIILEEELLISDLTLHASIQDLSLSYPIYLQPILLQTNFSDLELSGALDLNLDYKNRELNRMELIMDEVFLDDIESRFSISDLNSHLFLDSEPEAVQSTLDWVGMSFYRLDFGSGDIVFESTGKHIRVLNWKDVAILDGALKIKEFSIRNLASSDFEFRLGGELLPISMESLTHALGWTIFPGDLSGEISGLKYTKNNLQLEGDILVSLFGGFLNIQELKVEDLFSSYSVLTTGIKIDRLDLEQLTDVFSFGKIEGSLSGRMEKLRLEDWQPAYFEAEFATPLDDDKPHRISQKALENLNELGGGLSGTLSRGFLRFLPAYSYGRLGISCRLFNGICELGGVEDSGDSFSILTKGGLLPPWVEVIGAGRSIKWDDLIGGLKQIAEGEVAIE